MTQVILASTTGWTIGYIVGIVVVLTVVALVVPILMLARRIGLQAEAIDTGLQQAVVHTAALSHLEATIESAEAIVEGLQRGRKRLGG